MDGVRHRLFVPDPRWIETQAVFVCRVDFFFELLAGVFAEDFAELFFAGFIATADSFADVLAAGFFGASATVVADLAAEDLALEDASFAFFLSALAIDSASQSFFLGTPAVADLRLLSHAADPASPAISSIVRPVSTDLSYWSMS
jgi:hypothetical protein